MLTVFFSMDSNGSIRMAGHELDSLNTTKAHFHFETWVYDAGTKVYVVDNVLQRIDMKR